MRTVICYNIHMTPEQFNEIKECVAYREDADGCLVWIKKPFNKANNIRIGGPCGSYSIDANSENLGYYHFMFNYKQYRNHRIIWMLHNGFIEDNVQIDHIDQHLNGINNKIDNLRIATPSENALNKRKMKNNTSGFTGITWDKCNNSWKASIKINKCRKSKNFKNIEDAINWRDANRF